LAREEWARSGQGKKAENGRCGLGIEAERSDDGLRLDMPNRGRTGRGWPPRGSDWLRHLHHGDGRHPEDKPSISPERHPRGLHGQSQRPHFAVRQAFAASGRRRISRTRSPRAASSDPSRHDLPCDRTGRLDSSPTPVAAHPQWFTCEDPAARRGPGELVKGERRDAKVSPLRSVTITPLGRHRPLSAEGRASRWRHAARAPRRRR